MVRIVVRRLTFVDEVVVMPLKYPRFGDARQRLHLIMEADRDGPEACVENEIAGLSDNGTILTRGNPDLNVRHVISGAQVVQDRCERIGMNLHWDWEVCAETCDSFGFVDDE